MNTPYTEQIPILFYAYRYVIDCIQHIKTGTKELDSVRSFTLQPPATSVRKMEP